MISRFERFSFAIFEISRHWHKIAADVMEEYGLKGPHVIYLIALRRAGGGITAARLCALCDRDKADVSRAITLMEKQGLVAREGENSYRALLSLTPKGIEAADHVCGLAQTAVELASKDITDEYRETFYEALESVAANLRKVSAEGLPE